jgi:hypothetical protein
MIGGATRRVGPPCLRQTALRAALRGSRSALALAHHRQGTWQHRKEAHEERNFFGRVVFRLRSGRVHQDRIGIALFQADRTFEAGHVMGGATTPRHDRPAMFPDTVDPPGRIERLARWPEVTNGPEL